MLGVNVKVVFKGFEITTSKWQKQEIKKERNKRETNRNPGTKRKSLRKNKLKWTKTWTKTKQKDKKLGKSKTKEDKLKYYMYDRNTREKGYGLNL